MKLVGVLIGIIGLSTDVVLGQSSNIFNVTVTHSPLDSDYGKSFVIPNFLTNCIIKEIRVRANYISGQRRIWTVFIDDPNGTIPTDTHIPYRGTWDSSPVGEYAYIDNEIVYISADSESVLTVIRGMKGTIPTLYDYNTPIRIANNGLRLILFKDRNNKFVDNLKIMDRIMTWKGIADTWRDFHNLLQFTDNILNVDKYDILYMNGIIPEIAIVENVNNTLKIVSVSDSLLSHYINTDVQKQIVYKDPIFYSGENNLYGILFVDEKIDETIDVDIEIFTQQI